MIDAGTVAEADELDAAVLKENAVVDWFTGEKALDDTAVVEGNVTVGTSDVAVVEGGVTVGTPVEDDAI